MKPLISILFYLLSSICLAQNFCNYNKPKKFEEYSQDINTEYSGLFINGNNLAKKQFQIEVNSFLGTLINSYKSNVYAGFLQLRYALVSSTEIQIGGFFQNPPSINVDTTFNNQMYLGIKQKIFKIDLHRTKWYMACSAKYLVQKSWSDDVNIRNGISFSINNSWKMNGSVLIVLSGGSEYFPAKKLLQPMLSGNILIKDDLSKIGIFLGLCADHYTESLLSLGINYTDNFKYIILFSIGFLDNAVTPGISYTYLFHNSR